MSGVSQRPSEWPFLSHRTHGGIEGESPEADGIGSASLLRHPEHDVAFVDVQRSRNRAQQPVRTMPVNRQPARHESLKKAFSIPHQVDVVHPFRPSVFIPPASPPGIPELAIGEFIHHADGVVDGDLWGGADGDVLFGVGVGRDGESNEQPDGVLRGERGRSGQARVEDRGQRGTGGHRVQGFCPTQDQRGIRGDDFVMAKQGSANEIRAVPQHFCREQRDL